MQKKYTIDDVRYHFTKEGYTLVSDEYVDCKHKLDVICPNGHHFQMSYDCFRCGQRCKYCSYIKSSESQKLPLEMIRQVFEDAGCKFLEEIPTATRTHRKFRYICNCGRESVITYAHFRNGERCKQCGQKKQLYHKTSNGIVPVSLQQETIHQLIGGVLNYPVDKNALDIAFPDKKIYVEYDGSGHDLAVKKKSIQQEVFDEKQKRRNYALYRAGWKCIRVISRKDNFPSDDVFLSLYNQARMILDNGHHYCIIDIDNRTMEYGQVQYNIEIGKTHRIRRDKRMR